jgi:HEPN domain-containing protein
MSDPEHVVEAKRWLIFASQDLAAAMRMQKDEDYVSRHICWLAQQAAEKSIKAALILLQIDFPWRHDLDALSNLLPEDWIFKAQKPDLSALTEWAVEARYPGTWPEATTRDANSAVKEAETVVKLIREEFSRQGINIEGK